MNNSAVVASNFSLAFNNDFDYETFLIVGNTAIEETKRDRLLADSNRIAGEIESLTGINDNRDRLDGARKYLKNLEIYEERVKKNLLDGDKYGDSIQIWEKDIRIVTELLQETTDKSVGSDIGNRKAILSS